MAHYQPSIDPERVRERTGRTCDEWFPMLDRWGATGKSHQEIARYLEEEHGQEPWWAQALTVEYERARNLRQVGQTSTGDFAVSLQRTVAARPDEVKAWWLEEPKRRRWLDDELLAPAVTKGMKTVRSSDTAMGEVLRLEVMPDGPEKRQVLAITFTDKGDRTVVRVAHEKIADKNDRDALKERWDPLLDDLKRTVEAM